MNKRIATFLVGSLGTLALGTVMMVSAQDPPGPPPPPRGPEMGIVGFEEGPGAHVVTGVPVTAQTKIVVTQTLGDGTQINRTITGALYRDSQGRTRREGTMPGFGPMGESANAEQVVMIHDPVAGAHYLLEPSKKVAHKMGKGGHENAEAAHERGPKGDRGSNENVTKEPLGTQTINGVSAVGTRITRTIPAGQIGNDKPIQIVSERWYSNDLQVTVMSKHSDPRFGTTVSELSNVSRSEPAASLFQVPADYTVQTGGPGGRHGHGGPGGAGAPGAPPAPDEPSAPSQN
jgi:hypothetical protein